MGVRVEEARDILEKRSTRIFAAAGNLRRNMWRVQTLIIVLLVFPMIAFGVLTAKRIYDSDTKSALSENTSEAFLIATIVKERLNMLLEFGASIAQRPSLADYLKNGRWEEAIESIADIPEGFEYVDRIFLVDTGGIIKSQTPGTPRYSGLDRNEADWYRGVSRDWKPYLSEVYPDPIQPERSIIAAALPIMDSGNVLAILLFHAPVKIFSDLKTYEADSDPGQFFYIVDNKGRVVFHPKLKAKSDFLDFRSVPAVQKLLRGERGSEVNYNPIEKERRLVTFDIVPQFMWGVAIVKPYHVAFAERSVSLKNFVFVYGFILILTIAVIFLILHTLKERTRMDKLKDEFISTVSHEMRNPLFGIRESVAQISEGILGPVTKEQNEFLGIALTSIDRLGRIINDLLDVAKIEARKMALQLKWCDVTDIAERAMTSLMFQAESKGIELKGRFPEKNSEILADGDRLEQVFFNLIGNAVKFTPAGTVEVAVNEKEDALECSVSDTGTGMLDVQLKDIFSKEKKYTSVNRERGKGTGIGLFITKEIIDLHGGKVWIQSRVGKGTAVTFVLPKYAQEEAAKRFLENMKPSMRARQPLVMILCSIENFDTIKERMNSLQFNGLVQKLERCLNANIRRIAGDVVMKDESSFLAILPQLNREQGEAVRAKTKEAFQKCLAEEAVGQEVKISVVRALYPEVTASDKNLFSKIVNIVSGGKNS